MGLVRGAVRHYCLGGCSALVVCARRSRPSQVGWWPVLGFVSSPCPPSSPAFPAVRLAGCPIRMSFILACWYAIPCGLCISRARCSCPSGTPRVSFACLCAHAFAAFAAPVLGAGRAVPRGPCPSACPASVPCAVWLASRGGRPGPVPPLPGLGLCAPLWAGPWGVRPGLGGAAGGGVWTRHQPHSARSCEPALRAVGAAQGRPGEAPLAWVRGVRDRALSHLRPPVLWGVRPGPTTHVLWVRGVRACGPVTKPTARDLASWLCTLWGRHEGARGGAPLAWVWGVRGRALSQAQPPVFWGVWPGPITQSLTGCGCGGCGRGDLSPTPQRVFLQAGFARC